MSKLTSINFITNNGGVHFGEDGYGDLFIILKGPRGGDRGNDNITKEDAKRLAEFILELYATAKGGG